MKNIYLIIVLIMTLSFLLIPILAVENEKKVSENSQADRTGFLDNEAKLDEDTQVLNEILLYLSDEEKVVTLETKEYIVGVVAAEMSPENNIEALKAQALASYTYAYRKHLQNKQTSNEYDLTDDAKLDQEYISLDARKTKWGDKFDAYEGSIKQAVEAVENELIVYNNEPILSAYHKISPGKTETAKNIWGSDYPYLQAENSVGDLLCPEFYSEVVVSTDDFVKKLSDFGATKTDDINKLIGKTTKSDSGTVLNIELCGKEFIGTEIREIFGLKSAAFDVAMKDNQIVFSVSGNGHGVGMSQYGANYMAQQGSDYKEIISSYYRGVEIIKLK